MKSLELNKCAPVRKLTILVASGFGLGALPASGTFGTLLGVILVVGIPLHPWYLQAALALALLPIAVFVCDKAEGHYGTKDDGRVVADEYMTFPLCVIALPWQAHPWLLVAAFLTHRFFDIVKPFPARQIQSLKGGLGIVADDVFSSLYALAANHLAWWAFQRYLA